MKKIISITLLSFLTIISASAQDGGNSGMKGTFLLGGNQDFTTTTDEMGNTVSQGWTDINLTPEIGYFLTDKIAITLGMSYMSTDNNNTDLNVTMTALTFAPAVRYYLDNRLFLTGGFSMSSGTTTTKPDGGDASESSSSGMGIGVGAGYSLMWGDHIAIEPGVRLLTGSSSTKDGNTTTDGPSTMSLGFNLGITARF